MSTMLEQAIVDASALREAAIHSAEQAVISRYSDQIKGTVNSLLEQDELTALTPAEPAAAPPEGESYGDNTSAPKDKDEKSIIEAQLDEYDGKAYAFGDLSDSNTFELEADETIEIDLEKIVAESKNVVEVSEDALNELVSEEVSLSEEDLKEFLEDDEEEVIEEKMKVDYEAKPSGWMNRPSKVLDEEAALDLLANAIAEMELEVTKEHKEVNTLLGNKLKKTNKRLAKEQKTNERLSSENKALYGAVESLKTKFDEMVLINAKLLYTNKVLTNASLNERQKNEIVESIQKTNSIEKAKIVYETLQSAVGAPKTGPKSLSEAVGRRTNTSMLLKAQKPKENEDLQETFADRMKLLAGINN